MPQCPVCGRVVTTTSDWCVCGHYVGWQSAGPPTDTPPDSSAEAQPVLAVAASILLAFVGDAPADVVLEPGLSETLRLLIRNQSNVVRRFRVRIEGLPRECWSATPEEFGLNPWGTEPPFERHVTVELASHRVTPGRHLVRVAVADESSNVDAAALSLPVDIRPLLDIRAELMATRRVGFRTGRFCVRVENHGTATPALEVAWRDGDDELRFRPARQSIRLAPGASTDARVRVKARRWRWAGAPRELAFEAVGLADGRRIPTTLTGAFRQRALFPRITTGPFAVLGLAGIAAGIALSGGVPDTPFHRLPPTPSATPARLIANPSPVVTATPSPTGSPTPALTAIPTPTLTATPTPTPTPSPSATPSATSTPRPNGSVTTTLAGGVVWPDGSPVQEAPMAFLSGQSHVLTRIETNEQGTYRVSGLNSRHPVSAVLFVGSDVLDGSNDDLGCVLPLRPEAVNTNDEWAITPRENAAVTWAAADYCLESDAPSDSWTEAEDDAAAREGTTWQEVRDALPG